MVISNKAVGVMSAILFPVNWTASSERKKAFFRLLAEITGSNTR